MNIKSVTNSDMIKGENLLRIISKGRYDLSGTETMAFTECCIWLGRLLEEMKSEVDKQSVGIKVKKDPMSGPKPKSKAKAKKRKK